MGFGYTGIFDFSPITGLDCVTAPGFPQRRQVSPEYNGVMSQHSARREETKSNAFRFESVKSTSATIILRVPKYYAIPPYHRA